MTREERLIRAMARKHAIDEEAAIAVAMGEGGLRNREGDIGDQGRSFGPYQLFEDGALPGRFRGRPRQADAWAWSPKGINYAFRQMSKAGASGLRGPQAVKTIIRKFERPADPEKSIARALSRYGQEPANSAAMSSAPMQSGPQSARSGPPIPSRPGTVSQGPSREDLQQGVLRALMADRRAGGSRAGTLGALQQLQAWQPDEAEARARSYGGTTQPRTDPAGQVQGSRNPAMSKALAVARKQIGKPYVFGATGPNDFDCSGLIEYSLEQAGIKTPGRLWTGSMAQLGRSVKGEEMQPGDWLVRHSGGKGHVVWYVGNGQVIAAPHKGEVVQYQDASKFTGPEWDVRRAFDD